MIQFFKVTLTSWATRARTLIAQLRGVGEEGADDGAEAIDGVEVVQPMGLRVRPVIRSSLEAIVVELGDERVVIHLVDKSRQSGAVEPEAGGTILHSLGTPGTHVYLRSAGGIEVVAAGSAEVSVNGGTLKVARVTDPVRIGTLVGTAGPYPVLFTFTPQDASGTPGTPATGATATLTGVVSNAGGASRFKG